MMMLEEKEGRGKRLSLQIDTRPYIVCVAAAAPPLPPRVAAGGMELGSALCAAEGGPAEPFKTDMWCI
jgi:hypothetical protein